MTHITRKVQSIHVAHVPLLKNIYRRPRLNLENSKRIFSIYVFF